MNMKNTTTLHFIFIFALLVGFECQAENAYLDDMQIKTEEDMHTRVVFVLNGPVIPKVTMLKNPERVVVNLSGTQFRKPLAVTNPSTSIIDNVKSSKPGEENMLFIFELKRPAQVKSLIVEDESDSTGQQKLIVDLLPLSIPEKETLTAVPVPVAAIATGKDGEPNWQEQIRLLTQRFEVQQQKIKELETKVQQQEGRLLAVNQQRIQRSSPKQRTQMSPPPGALPMSKSASSATATKTKRRGPPREEVLDQALHQVGHSIWDQSFTIEPGFSYTRIDRSRVALSGFLVLDAIALGTISVDEVESDILLFDLTGRYGLTDRLQLDVNVPFLHRSTTFRESVDDGEDDEKTVKKDFALSDVSFGFSYQVFSETANWPDVVWSTRVRTPTGTDPFGIKQISIGENGNLQAPEELPTGNGNWALTSGFSFVKTLDPVVLFASLSYSYNFEEDYDDISSRTGLKVPGSVDLGNAIQFGLGFAVAFNERTSMSISYTQRFSDEARTKVKGGKWNDVVGSDASSGLLNIGLIVAITPKFSIIASVAAGLTDDAPDSQFSLKFPYTF